MKNNSLHFIRRGGGGGGGGGGGIREFTLREYPAFNEQMKNKHFSPVCEIKQLPVFVTEERARHC